MSTPCRIGVLGYYGAGNLGDEAILTSILASLERRGVREGAVVFSEDPDHTRAHHGVDALPARLYRRPEAIGAVLGRLRRLDGLVVGGGGLFHDYYRSVVPFYAGWTRLARWLGVRVALYGVGVGPLWRAASRRRVRGVYRRSDVSIVRDPRSYEWIRRVAGDQDRLELGADAVFLHPRAVAAPEGAVESVGDIAVSLRPWGFRGARGVRAPEPVSPEQWRGRLVELVDHVGGLADGRLVLLCLQPGQDDVLAEEVRSRSRHAERIEVVELGEVGDEELDRLARFSLVVAMRLHAALLTALAGGAVMPVVYDEKVDSLASELGLRAWSTHVDQLGTPDVLRAISRAYAERDQIRRTARLQVDELRTIGRRGEASLHRWIDSLEDRPAGTTGREG